MIKNWKVTLVKETQHFTVRRGGGGGGEEEEIFRIRLYSMGQLSDRKG